MKLLLTLVFTFTLTLSAFAQAADSKGQAASPPPAGMDENARLMQEYMARRAEWVDLRRSALDKVKAAKTDKEKKQHRDKLAKDEEPLLAKMGEAARAYQAAEKARHDSKADSKPRG